MFDFLRKSGVNDETIALIIEKNSQATIDDFLCNEDNCVKIISYLNEIGIKNINELLIYRIDIFMGTFSIFKERIDKVDRNKLIHDVNADCFSIDMIFE